MFSIIGKEEAMQLQRTKFQFTFSTSNIFLQFFQFIYRATVGYVPKIIITVLNKKSQIKN